MMSGTRFGASLSRYLVNEAGLEIPRYPLETSSTFATVLLVQQDPTLLAVIPVEVAGFCEQFDLLVKLPMSLRALIEPYGVISRAGADLSSPFVIPRRVGWQW
jgi:hypothetical protein